jgi:hypothetical protein
LSNNSCELFSLEMVWSLPACSSDTRYSGLVVYQSACFAHTSFNLVRCPLGTSWIHLVRLTLSWSSFEPRPSSRGACRHGFHRCSNRHRKLVQHHQFFILLSFFSSTTMPDFVHHQTWPDHQANGFTFEEAFRHMTR